VEKKVERMEKQSEDGLLEELRAPDAIKLNLAERTTREHQGRERQDGGQQGGM
jgi:hypothetical protein